MSRVLVGVFDKLADAKGLYEELVSRHGIAPREIHVTAAHPAASGMTAGPHAPRVQDSVDRSNSVQGSVGDMFRALFIHMGGKSDDERLYDEAVHRGATVVMVPADNDARVRAVTEAMQRHRVVDIQARGEPLRAPRRRLDAEEETEEQRRLGRFMAGDHEVEVESVGGVRIYRSAVHPDAVPGGRSQPPE